MPIPPLVSPESVGLCSTRLARIDQLSRRYIENNQLAGTITLVARHGQVAHLSIHGKRDLEADLPMEADTLFRIYSMTKPITTVAAMMLFEQGAFLLDTPIDAFIPEFRAMQVCTGSQRTGPIFAAAKRPITFKDLMTHTAGLSYGWFHDTPVDALYRKAKLFDRTLTLEEGVAKLADLPLCFHPGKGWRYSFATDVLGRLVEVISGKSLDRYFEEEIFQPLGMRESAFHVAADQVDRFSAVYSPFESFGFVQDADEEEEADGTIYLLDAPQESRFTKPPAFLSGGGGLVSTTADYLRFAQFLLNQGELDGTRLLGRKTVALMMQNHLPASVLPFGVGDDASPGMGFGLGGSIVMDVAETALPGSPGAYGWGGAASTTFWVDPQEDLLAIFMTQLMPAGHYPLNAEFRRSVYQALID